MPVLEAVFGVAFIVGFLLLVYREDRSPWR